MTETETNSTPPNKGESAQTKGNAPAAKRVRRDDADPRKMPEQRKRRRPAQGNQGKKPQTNNPQTDNIGGIENVFMRNDFYKDGYRSILRIAIFEAVGIVVLIFVLGFFVLTTKPEQVYFATTADGRLIQMVPLNQPNLSNAALLSWVAKASTETMTFGFHDYKTRLQKSSSYFTRRGWQSFTKALQDSSVIDAVEARKQVLSAVPGSAPIVVQEGIVNNQYRWVVEMPLIVTYKSGSSSRPDSMLVRLTVVRVPTLDNPNGVGIEQWTTGLSR